MPSVRLTDKHVLAVKAERGKRIDVFDLQEPGLLLRVSDAGRKTWYLRYRLADGRQPRLKLGTYPATGIAEARRKAQETRRVVEAGEDPAAQARKAAAVAKNQKIRTYADLIAAYFTACENGTWTPKGKRKRPQTIAAERKLYERHIKKDFARRTLGEIGRAEVKTLTRGMLAKGITTQSNHAHALIRQTFSYALEEELVENNPAMGMASPAPKRARERALGDEELKALWEALVDSSGLKNAEGEPIRISEGVALALRLTMLLLQRRAEVATMRVQDVDLDAGIWILPNEMVKNGRAHAVPLPPTAVDLIGEALKLKNRGKSPYVFPSPRNKAISVHPDALTRAMGGLMKALGLPLAGPHDLRRTGATNMASERLGIAPFVISQVLNHTTDAGGGSVTTRRHYNVHLYAAEKRRALTVWQDLLLDIVGARERPSNVVDFSPEAANG